MNLLAKTRQLNRMLQKAAGQSVNFMEMAEVLRDTVNANVYVVSRKGKLLGYSIAVPIHNERMRKMVYEEGRFSNELNMHMLNIKETTSNTDLGSQPLDIEETEALQSVFTDKLLTIVPIIGGGDRLGTLVLVRVTEPFVDDDLILSEYGSTIIGMEILRERAEEIELEARGRAAVQVAMASLSYSELEAVEHIFEELDGNEGLLVASKIADRVGITRSVIVNALRKLESAGVVESRSLGMKGTFIKILNSQILDELRKNKS